LRIAAAAPYDPTVKLRALALLPALACAPQGSQDPSRSGEPSPLVDTTVTPSTAFQVPVQQAKSPEPRPPPEPSRLRKIELRIADGILVGASPEVIDAIDAAFVARLDLLAILHDGDIVRAWVAAEDRVVAAAAPIGGGIMRIARFDGAVHGWFDEQGMGMDGAFRARPVYASRITSRYGVRFHPVDKRSSLHKGTDYGAVLGTPVHVTAAGVIETATQDASAGKHIRVRHAGRAQTLYLHLSAFAADIGPGVRVEADQVIGFVGTTGKSTGPHLHYELRFAGVPVDAPRMIPRGLTALGLTELRQHQAFLATLP
jgi:hypothetical protein